MKHTPYILFLVAVFLLCGCRRQEEPISTTDNPVFALTGIIDNQPVKLIAGEGFYMHTDYAVDSQGVLVLEGNLKEDCAGCKRSLKILIRNNRVGTGIPDIRQSIGLRDYPFVGSGFPQQCMAFFQATGTGAGIPAHTWTFSDGTSYTSDTVTKLFSVPSSIGVRCSSEYNGCSSVIESPVYFRSTAGQTALGISALALNATRDSFQFTATDVDSSSGLYVMHWDFGDGQTTYGDQVIHTYPHDSQPWVKRITLSQIKPSVGDTNQVVLNLPIKNFGGCVANFEVTRHLINDPLKFSGVTVLWTDANGVTYSSDKAPQDATGKFTITGISDYQPDKDGRKTVALDLLIDCKVSDGARTLSLKNISGRMAIAYP